MSLRNLFTFKRSKHQRFSVPDGQRWYAIGDIHGCYDLLNQLLVQIDQDDEERGSTDTRLLFLGDYIDRGPNSRKVIDLMIRLDLGNEKVIFLMGNHEETLLATAEGHRRAATLFHKMGGRETLMSYGVSAQEYDLADPAGIIDLVRKSVPVDHISWLKNLRSSHRVGSYLFVHAGIRPGIAISNQNPSDLRWIRYDFLKSIADHSAMIVHGHSISDAIEEKSNRIGIDTGAYVSGKLTAIGLEKTSRWFLQTNGSKDFFL